MRLVGTVAERFWPRVDRRGDDECWPWLGHITRLGYGKFSESARRSWLPHRLAYVLMVGPIPKGLELDHTCRNRACCNPAHLEPVTHTENVRRGARHARAQRSATCQVAS